MSSIAGPSSHTFSAFSAHTAHARQSPTISTKLRRVQNGPDPTPATPSTPNETLPTGVGSNAATAPPTAPATPIARSSSLATTDVREMSQGPGMVNGSTLNGTYDEAMKTTLDPKATLAPDLDAVRTRAILQSKKRERGADEEDAMVQTAVRCVSTILGPLCLVLSLSDFK